MPSIPTLAACLFTLPLPVYSVLLLTLTLHTTPTRRTIISKHTDRMFSVASSGKLGQDLTWEFFQTNFERIKGMLAKASPSLMDAVILFCCGGFTEEGKMQEVCTHDMCHDTRSFF